MDIGVLWKPERPCCFLVKNPAERPDDQLSARRFAVVTTRDTKRTAATRGTAERREPKQREPKQREPKQREPKQRGTDNRESERSDSTDDVGELALSEDPAQGSGTSH